MKVHATALTVLALLPLLPSATAAVWIYGFASPEALGPIPPPICEPTSIGVDVPPRADIHWECLPSPISEPSAMPLPSESIEAPNES